MNTGIFITILIFMSLVKPLCVGSYNVRSLTGGKNYIYKLLNDYDIDILCIAEHRLYANELYKLNSIHSDYDTFGKSSNDLDSCNQHVKPGHCGIALLWRKCLSGRIRVVECRSDRICVIEIMKACGMISVFVIGLYLPHQTCKISDFNECIVELSTIITESSAKGEVIVIGDMNCHFGEEVGNRFWGQTTRNAKCLLNVVNANDMVIIDGDNNMCSGPKYTYTVHSIGKTYIDHCITSKNIALLTNCMVVEDALNVSDHLPIVTKIRCNVLVESQQCEPSNARVAWNKLSESDIKEKIYATTR